MISEVFIFAILFLVVGGTLVALFTTLLKREQARQQTLQKALDSGQQLTPELVEALGKSIDLEARDYKRGVLISLFGVAFLVFALLIDMPDEAARVIPYLSLFPIFIGFGYLLVWKTRAGRR